MIGDSSKIQPESGERPSHFAERLGNLYSIESVQKDKKHKGQFFTPFTISDFMGGLASTTESKEIEVLDPGCGCAILSCSLIEHLVKSSNLISISLDVYETDNKVINYTKSSISYLGHWLNGQNIKFKSEIIQDDFILSNINIISDSIFTSEVKPQYDYIISNPPYFKLGKDDSRTKACLNIINGQTNIYSLFMAVSSRLLKEGGEMIFITPRSFASGRYFQSFRNDIFNRLSLTFIHLFNTRKDTFAKDDVLQELIISKLSSKNDSSEISISYSNGISDLGEAKVREYPKNEIIDTNTPEKIIYLPVNDREDRILNLFKSWDGNMEKYGLRISTGPVVSFRAYESIAETQSDDTVPLFWLHNVVKMLADHPIQKKDKGQFIKVSPGTMPILLPNKNYILLRRFSSKDDDSRLIAAPYFGNMSKYEYVGIENKLNYIYRQGNHLKRDEAIGLSALLDSKLFDTFFRTFNGNINVSATELRMMPLPPIETIREIGQRIILHNNYSIEFIEEVIKDYFNIN